MINHSLGRRSVIVIGASSLVAPPAYAQSSSGTPVQLPAFNMMTTSDIQIGGPWIVAREKGFFAAEGLSKLDLKQYPAAPPAFPAFASGELKVMSTAEQPAIALASSGMSVKFLCAYAEISGLHGFLGSAKIKTPKDLEGKKVGVQVGSVLEWYLRSFCKAFGVDLSKVQVINMAAPEGLTAFLNGNIDGLAIWQPFIERALEGGKKIGAHLLHYNNTSLVPGAEGPKKLHNTSANVWTTEAFLQSNASSVDAVLRVLKRSVLFIKSNTDEAARILGAEFKLPPETAKSQMSAVSYGLRIDDTMVQSNQALADLLLAEKIIKKPVDFAKTMLDVAPLKRVAPEAVTYNSR